MLIGTRFGEGTNDKREQHQQKGAAAAFTHKPGPINPKRLKQNLDQQVIHIYLFGNFTIFLSNEIRDSPHCYQVTGENCESGSGIVFLCPMQQFIAA